MKDRRGTITPPPLPPTPPQHSADSCCLILQLNLLQTARLSCPLDTPPSLLLLFLPSTRQPPNLYPSIVFPCPSLPLSQHPLSLSTNTAHSSVTSTCGDPVRRSSPTFSPHQPQLSHQQRCSFVIHQDLTQHIFHIPQNYLIFFFFFCVSEVSFRVSSSLFTT